MRSASGLATPPGRTSASKPLGVGLGDDLVHAVGAGLVEVVEGLDLAGLGAQQDRGEPGVERRPAHGSVSSTCSMPSVATRKATRPVLTRRRCPRARRRGRGPAAPASGASSAGGGAAQQRLLEPTHAEHEAQGGERDEDEQDEQHLGLRCGSVRVAGAGRRGSWPVGQTRVRPRACARPSRPTSRTTVPSSDQGGGGAAERDHGQDDDGGEDDEPGRHPGSFRSGRGGAVRSRADTRRPVPTKRRTRTDRARPGTGVCTLGARVPIMTAGTLMPGVTDRRGPHGSRTRSSRSAGRRDVTVAGWPSVAGGTWSTPPTVCGGTSTRWPRSSLSTKRPGAGSSGA